MEKKFTTKVMAEIAIFAAVGFVLDALQSGLFKAVFPNGGSIGIAMVPVLIIAYRRGFRSGVLCGLIVSVLQMLSGIYIIQGAILENDFLKVCGPFIQIMLDYVLGYTLIGFAGLFSKAYKASNGLKFVVLGTCVGGLLKFMSHFLAGVLFWPGELWGVTGAGYSALYNGLYCIPNIIVAVVIMVIIAKYYPQFLNDQTKEAE